VALRSHALERFRRRIKRAFYSRFDAAGGFFVAVLVGVHYMPKREPELYQTVLVSNPRYLKAIGTLSVEITNMEIMLAELLAAILDLPRSFGQTIYWTPRAHSVRIDILNQTAKHAFAGFPKYQGNAGSIAKRALGIANARHEIVHESWGLTPDRTRITRRRLPLHRNSSARRIPLSEITDEITKARKLIGEVISLTKALRADGDYPPSPHKRNKQFPAENQKK
jgi:hypothetical protein